jgi:protein-disulfide isomerase
MKAIWKDSYTNVLMVIAVACALILTALTIHQQLFPKVSDGTPDALRPRKVKGAAAYAAVGHRMGPANARVTIVEFGDFECPICARFESGALRDVRTKYPADVAVVFRHWPLSIHKFAYPAARASECAADQGRFEPFHDVLYAHPDSLGLLPFSDIATRSGVADLKRFQACIADTARVPAIEADMKAATALGGRGTPTLLINDVLLLGAPKTQELDSLVQAAIRNTAKTR